MLAHLPAVRRAGEALLCRAGAQPQAERRLLHAGTGCTWGDLRWRLSCGAVLAVRGQGAPCHRCPSASSSSTCSRSSGMRTHTQRVKADPHPLQSGAQKVFPIATQSQKSLEEHSPALCWGEHSWGAAHCRAMKSPLPEAMCATPGAGGSPQDLSPPRGNTACTQLCGVTAEHHPPHKQ